MIPVSTFMVVKVEPGMVWIVDLDKGRSVTNDAERVCQVVNAEHRGCRIIYRDTAGCWDELAHIAGVFKDYAPARELGARYERESADRADIEKRDPYPNHSSNWPRWTERKIDGR